MLNVRASPEEAAGLCYSRSRWLPPLSHLMEGLNHSPPVWQIHHAVRQQYRWITFRLARLMDQPLAKLFEQREQPYWQVSQASIFSHGGWFPPSRLHPGSLLFLAPAIDEMATDVNFRLQNASSEPTLQTRCQYFPESMFKNNTVTGFCIWLTTSPLCQENGRLLLHVATVFEWSLMQCQLIWRKVQFLPALFWDFWWGQHAFFEEWLLKWIHEKKPFAAPSLKISFPQIQLRNGRSCWFWKYFLIL